MGFSEDALCGGFDVVDETIQVLPGLDVGGDTSQVLPGLDVVDNTFPGADPEYGWFFAAAQGAKKNKGRSLYSMERSEAYKLRPKGTGCSSARSPPLEGRSHGTASVLPKPLSCI